MALRWDAFDNDRVTDKKKKPSAIIGWILIGGGVYVLISRLYVATQLEDPTAGDFIQATAYSAAAIVFGIYILRLRKKIESED